MIFAEFWHYGTDSKIRPACGSDSVVIIDGRFGLRKQHDFARQVGSQKQSLVAYVIRAGRSFSDSRPLMEMPGWLRVNSVPDGRPLHPSEVSTDFIRNGKVI